MRIVDTKGQPCPAPIIAAKRALKETAEGDSFLILTDNNASFNNLTRFLSDNRAHFTVRASGGIWELTVTKKAGNMPELKPEDYCSPVAHFEKGDFIIVISSDKTGEGDAELGHLLTLNFIKAVKDLDKLPQKMIFYNSGVKLAVDGSPVIDLLRDLEKMGVELMLCTTCVAHYKLENSVVTGTLGNMFTIASIMASAGKIIKP